MHHFLGAAGTGDYQQGSPVDHTARLRASASDLLKSAAVARTRLVHGSPPQFPTTVSVDKLWLLQSAGEQALSHSSLVWCVGKVPCGKNHRLLSADSTV